MVREFKIRRRHDEASRTLRSLQARFVGNETLDDLYLVESGKNIWKLSRVGKTIKLLNLVYKNGGFVAVFGRNVALRTCKPLNRFLNRSGATMRKVRRHYKWHRSEIVLDHIAGLGEFVEFYPADDKEKRELFKVFRVDRRDLISEGYNTLMARKAGRIK